MNGMTTANAVAIPLMGWNGSDVLLDPTTYNYYNSSFSRDSGEPRIEANYSTDLIRDYTLGYLDTIASARRNGSNAPFFISVQPIAPHFVSGPRGSVATGDPDAFITYPPIPAPRHANLFANATAPKGVSYNPSVASGAGWVYDLAMFNSTVSDYHDNWYRQRLRSIQAVDELVESVFQRLESANLLDNTYVMFPERAV